MGRPPKKKPTTNAKEVQEEPIIQCVTCGIERKASEFYTNKPSKFFNINGNKVPFCKSCLQKLIEEFSKRYDEKTALKIVCAALDMPYVVSIYSNMIRNSASFNIGTYIRQLQLYATKKQSFLHTIVDDKLIDPENRTQEIGTRWKKTDKNNKNYVISTVGYDPFDDGTMSDDDLRYCYNILAGYCDIEDIKDDAHKMLSCIQIATSQLQVKKIDELIAGELKTGSDSESKIKMLTESKKKLQDIIAKIAADNNIASNFNKNSGHGKNTLSQKMKDMLAEGYEAIRVNLYDIKTSEAIKQVADISNRSIMEQLNLDANDYSEMVKEQRELIIKLQEKCDELEESNRNLKNELMDFRIAAKNKSK